MFRSANVSKWIKQLAEWYANDPNPAIQSACGWLLWHWDEDPLAEFVVRTPLAYDPQRERFLTEVKYGEDDNAEKDYFTFIVFPPERKRSVPEDYPVYAPDPFTAYLAAENHDGTAKVVEMPSTVTSISPGSPA